MYPRIGSLGHQVVSVSRLYRCKSTVVASIKSLVNVLGIRMNSTLLFDVLEFCLSTSSLREKLFLIRLFACLTHSKHFSRFFTTVAYVSEPTLAFSFDRRITTNFVVEVEY